MAVQDTSMRSLAELISLQGRAAVVTGGAHGIGYAVAGRLAEAGANVLLADVDGGAAWSAADELAARYVGKVLGAEVAVTEPHALRDLADRAVADFGRLDIWVDALVGTFGGAREAARRMVEDGIAGVVVSVTPERTALTESLALDLAPQGIRVLAVAPASDRTEVAEGTARVVLFAVSDLAAAMTGSTLVVDAGDLVR